MKKIVPISKLSKSALIKKYDALQTKYHDETFDSEQLRKRVSDLEGAALLTMRKNVEQTVKLNAEIKECKAAFNMLLMAHTKVTMSLPSAPLVPQ